MNSTTLDSSRKSTVWDNIDRTLLGWCEVSNGYAEKL